MMRTVIIEGGYAEQCPPVKLNGDSVQQIVRGLEYTYPSFRRKFYETPWSVTARNPKQQTSIHCDPLMTAANMELGHFTEVHFTPDIDGGYFIIPYIVPYLTSLGLGTVAANAVATVAVTAASVAITYGLQQAFQPSVPKIQDQAAASGSAEHPSFLYNAAPNVSEQGNVIPLIYGRMRVGCTIISTGLTTTEIEKTRSFTG